MERHYLPEGYALGAVRYFTAAVTEKVETTLEQHERYQLWLHAARTIPGLEVVFGFRKKGEGGKGRQEKETDVNLAVELLLDGMNGFYDRAIVLSGDADQIPAIPAIPAAQRAPLHPMAPHQIDAARITEKQLAGSLLRYRLDGVRCPHYWRLPPKYLDAHCPPRHRPDL